MRGPGQLHLPQSDSANLTGEGKSLLCGSGASAKRSHQPPWALGIIISFILPPLGKPLWAGEGERKARQTGSERFPFPSEDPAP